MAIKHRIVFDTETCPLDKDFEGVSPWNMFVYDFGWCVTDRNGIEYKKRSYIVKEIFFGENGLMQSAHYAKKIPMYLEDIANGTRIVASWYEIRKAFFEDCLEYNIKEVFAHNCYFDYGAITNTQRWLTKSKYRQFFPYWVTLCCTLKMSRQLLKNSRLYKNFCYDNGFVTKKNQPRYTAEILYRFITKNLDFEESHTGLEDVLIEKEILKYLFSKHKVYNAKLWG